MTRKSQGKDTFFSERNDEFSNQTSTKLQPTSHIMPRSRFQAMLEFIQSNTQTRDLACTLTSHNEQVMSKEKEATKLSNGSGKTLSAPPGFASLTSFKLKRIRAPEKHENLKVNASLKICSGSRPWILFNQENHEPDKPEFESDQSEKDLFPEDSLPKGVNQGCPTCSDCVNVTARWRPKDARTDVNVPSNAPIYYPTEEEFEDTVTYLAKIRPSAQPYGICRIVPPPSWNPPCVIKEKTLWDDTKFATQVQRIDGLQIPRSNSESDRGNSKRRRTLGKGLVFGYNGEHAESRFIDAQNSQPLYGPELTVATFKKYADDFKNQYFRRSESEKSSDSSIVSLEKWEPSIKNIEGEYRRIIDSPTDEIEVLCCDGSDSVILGSGFPTASKTLHPEIVKSNWNLNHVPTLPRTLLSSEISCNSALLEPRVRLGMCFSTHHWRVEEHHLYALCYLHLGAPKIWYAVPSRDSLKLQVALKTLPAQHRLVKHLLPSALMSEGIPVFRCVQNSGEFVVIFPGAYHSGFDCGFNVSETANFAPLDWLPYGQTAVELYREVGRKTWLSHDKLLLRAANLAVRAQWEVSLCGKDTLSNLFWKGACGNKGILTSAFKFRVMCEETARKFLCDSSRARKMDENFDATTKRECKICLCDLHFSAAGCPCSPNVFSCLNHATQLCSTCPWDDKFFLFRDDISDLNLLVEALDEKLTSIFKIAKEKLGLSLSSMPRSLPVPSQEQSPVPLSRLDKPSKREPSSSIRAEVRARVLQSAIFKKKISAKPSSSVKDSEPTKTSNREEPKQKIAEQDSALTVDASRSFPRFELILGNSSDSCTSESGSDESDGIK